MHKARECLDLIGNKLESTYSIIKKAEDNAMESTILPNPQHGLVYFLSAEITKKVDPRMIPLQAKNVIVLEDGYEYFCKLYFIGSLLR